LTFTLALIVAGAVPAGARTWTIQPDGLGDFPTIQDGVSASAGDTVLLLPGTYTGTGNREIQMGINRNVVLRSRDGAAATTIDCQGVGRGIHINEASRVVIEGLRIINGVADTGGGIYVYDFGGNPEVSIRDCILTGNTAVSGGAIAVSGDNGSQLVQIEFNTIRGNRATKGGGLYLGDTSFCRVANNVIVADTAVAVGGGVYATALAGGDLLHNAIVSNQAPNGAGIAIIGFAGMFSVANNWVGRNNHGGILFEPPKASPQGNVISANIGSGITVSYNQSVPPGDDILSGNTIVNELGPGIEIGGSAGAYRNMSISNTIFSSIQGPAVVFTGNPASAPTVTLTCNDFFPGYSQIPYGIDGGGNIFDDPLFCDPVADSTFTISWFSRCAAANSPCGTRIGAAPTACASPAPVPDPEISCPPFLVVPPLPYSQVILSGFSMTNTSTTNLSFAYSLSLSGPGILTQNGDPTSLVGTTPVLAPGQSFAPPAASVFLLNVSVNDQVRIAYFASTTGPLPDDSCSTFIQMELPVPAAIISFSADLVANVVRLSWEVGEQQPVSGFEILRKEVDADTPVRIGSQRLIAPTARHFDDRTARPGTSYEYSLIVLDGENRVRSAPVRITTQSVATELRQNYPNPFNPSTSIPLSIDRDSRVVLSVYDAAGRLVRTLLDGRLDAGNHVFTWDGRDSEGRKVSTGVYFYRMAAGHRRFMRKAVLLK